MQHWPLRQMPVFSSQGVFSFALLWVQPVAGSQPSFVQSFSSSQLGAGPPMQVPLAQASLVVHSSLSSQVSELFMFWQPAQGTQTSVVQGLSLSQKSSSVSYWQPREGSQVSMEQSWPSLQRALFGVKVHFPLVHASVVHGMSSLQAGPQLPPQPLSPQSLPSQAGIQHVPERQTPVSSRHGKPSSTLL
jgi:hypothetical protein